MCVPPVSSMVTREEKSFPQRDYQANMAVNPADEDDIDAQLALFEREIDQVCATTAAAPAAPPPPPPASSPAPAPAPAPTPPIHPHPIAPQPWLNTNNNSHEPRPWAYPPQPPQPYPLTPSSLPPHQLQPLPQPMPQPVLQPMPQPPSHPLPRPLPQTDPHSSSDSSLPQPQLESPKPSFQKPKLSASAKRTAAGQVWTDPSLDEWPADDHRLFVGDLGPDATDTQLANAFSKYSSFNMARVVKDKRTSACRGYGFVSFASAADVLVAIKEMNGKYVGSRPVKLRRSNWKKRSLTKDKWKQVHAFRSISKRR